MSADVPVAWAELAPQLVDAARRGRAWYLTIARELVGPADRLAVDVGCGAAGMALAIARMVACGQVVAVNGHPAVVDLAQDHIRNAWSDPRIRVEVRHADIRHDEPALRETLDRPADLVWASAAVHHLGDQQAAISTLASLLAPGGRLALAEGGLPEQHLPWDVGLGDPGLEARLQSAQDRWFTRMRADLPGSRRMPYGGTEALRRAGLSPVTTRTTLHEQPSPLHDTARRAVLAHLSRRVGWLRPTGLLSAGDLDAWDCLLEPADEQWLRHRGDLFRLSARSVHVGVRP
ncbi:class I SAM-dependent methyltransferase [Micromonospora musae]|uniref:Class I SAM-dependent methyltransferase n=1 Tax=Micromonospora musae TaxID=1894970 RepID=A0A3A9Y8P1_9ACTN|nr:class I SAM-dependent methyltransferase [Micromonospora musae]RKN33855.1 class I SAM-dependent methyltransferase [Micromonospora musae]